MNNSPYLDRPLVPLAVALRSMLAETEAKIAAAEPAEQRGLQATRSGASRVAHAQINVAALDLATFGPGRASLSGSPLGWESGQGSPPARCVAVVARLCRLDPCPDTFWTEGR